MTVVPDPNVAERRDDRQRARCSEVVGGRFGLLPPVLSRSRDRPALCAGATAVSEVELLKLWTAMTPSKRTTVPLALKFVPVIVTIVVPFAKPLFGLRLVIVGPPV